MSSIPQPVPQQDQQQPSSAPAPMPGMGGGFPAGPMMAQAGQPPALGQPPVQKPSKVDAAGAPSPKAKKGGFPDFSNMSVEQLLLLNLSKRAGKNPEKLALVQAMMKESNRDDAKLTGDFLKSQGQLKVTAGELSRIHHYMGANNIDSPMWLKSRIPTVIQSRIYQASIIPKQIEDIEKIISKGDVGGYMGPLAGRTIGPMAAAAPEAMTVLSGMVPGGQFLGDPKDVSELWALGESLAALQPIVHGYRGGFRTHEIFSGIIGTDGTFQGFHVTEGALRGRLRALRNTARNIILEAKRNFPDDPYWAQYEKTHGSVDPGEPLRSTSPRTLEKDPYAPAKGVDAEPDPTPVWEVTPSSQPPQ